jgi:hypothetical protein
MKDNQVVMTRDEVDALVEIYLAARHYKSMKRHGSTKALADAWTALFSAINLYEADYADYG